MPGATLKVLLVEDNPDDRMLLQRALDSDLLNTFALTCVERLADGLAQLAQSPFDIVLLDLGLPDSQGPGTFEKLHHRFPMVPVLVFSGNTDEADAIQAARAGAQDYLVKSLGGFEMAARAIRYAIERGKLGFSLAESERRFSTVFHTSPVGLVLLALPEQTIVDINPVALELWMLDRDDALGRTTLELGITVNPQQREASYAKVASNENIQNLEICAQRKDGTILDLIVSVSVIEIDGRHHALASILDNTERKNAERKLLQSQADLAEAQRVAKLGSWRFDVATGAVRWSDELYRVFGVEQETFGEKYESFIRYVHPEDRHLVLATNRRAVEGGEPFEIEYRIVSSSGALKHIRELGHAIRDDTGKVVGLFGVAHDITENKQAEEHLRQSEEQYRYLFENNPHPMWAYDLQSLRFLAVNDSAVEKYGYSREEFFSMTIADIRPKEDVERLHQHLQEERSAIQHSGQWRHRLKDGRVIDVEITSHTLALDGRPASLVVAQDISERKKAEALVFAQRDLARAIGKTHSLRDGLRLCLGTALNLSGLDSGSIYLLDTYRRSLELQYAAGLGDAFVQAVSRYPVESSNAQIILQGETLVLSASHPVMQEPVYQLEGLRALAVVPIHYQEQVIGCLNLASHTLAQVPTTDVGMLETLAAEIGNFVVYLRSESALRISEEQYRGLAMATDALVSLVDMDGRLRYLNEAAAAYLGIKIEDALDKTLRELLPRALADLGLEMAQKVIRSGQGMVLELPAGERFYRVSTQPMHDEQNQPVVALVSAVEITQLKHTQKQLEALNRSLEERVRQRTAEVQDLYDNAPTGYHSLDAQGNFVMLNQTELNWLGYTRGELVGVKNFGDILTPVGRQTFRENFQKFKQQGRIHNLEFDLVRKDGSTFPVLVSATAIRDEQGNFVMSRSTVFDNTERKRAEDALRASEAELRQSRDQLSAANAALERAARLKDEFLASMSHELRTPLTGILGLAEALQLSTYGELSERQLKSVKNIESSGRHLLELINDILDLSKIEAGKFEMQFENCSLGDICHGSLQLTRSMANKKHQNVSFSMTPASIELRADARRLKQMFVNLLSNAIKFTPEDGSLGLEVVASADEKIVRITVWDHGIGIAPQDIDRLFRPFVQLDSSLSRQHAGTGLGLSLVSHMAELHGGSVSVESTPGKGSRFSVQLPWQPPESALPPRSETGTPQEVQARTGFIETIRTRILLVDDNDMVLEIMTDFFEAQNFDVTRARSGNEALNLVVEVLPNVILMDIQMPGMDGLEVIRRLRSHDNPQIARTPIVAMTALAMPGDRELCLGAGANHYLSKPVQLYHLLAILRELMAK